MADLFVMGADGALNVELPRFEEAVQVTGMAKGFQWMAM